MTRVIKRKKSAKNYTTKSPYKRIAVLAKKNKEKVNSISPSGKKEDTNKKNSDKTKVKESKVTADNTAEAKENKEKKNKNNMNNKTLDQISEILDGDSKENEVKAKVKVEKKEKGLIERTEDSTILLTEDNKTLLTD